MRGKKGGSHRVRCEDDGGKLNEGGSLGWAKQTVGVTSGDWNQANDVGHFVLERLWVRRHGEGVSLKSRTTGRALRQAGEGMGEGERGISRRTPKWMICLNTRPRAVPVLRTGGDEVDLRRNVEGAA